MADPLYLDPDRGAVGQVARHYRQLVAHADRRATLALSHHYELISNRISVQLEAVLADIARTEAAGFSPGFTQLYRRERLGMLLQDVGAWFQEASKATGVTMSPAVKTAVRLGEKAAGAAINARLTGQWENAPAGRIGPPAPGAPSITFHALPHAAIEEIAGVLQPGSPVGELLERFGTEAGQQASEILTHAVAQGLNPEAIANELASALLPKDVASAMDEVVNAAYRRALTIARTEIWRAYRTATHRTYQANDHIVKGWIWRAHLSSTTCAACAAMHGTVHPLSEDMASHPSCRCVAMPQTYSWAEIYKRHGISGPMPPERSLNWSTNQPGDAWLKTQSTEHQNRVLGSELAGDLWRAGDVELRDFVVTRRSVTWGKTYSRGSAAGALERAEKRRVRGERTEEGS